MDLLIDIHAWLRWLVLIVVIAMPALGFVRYSRNAPWSTGSDRPFALGAVVVDIEIALGVVLWIGTRAWDSGFFFAVIHPVSMLAAVAALHIGVGRARRVSARSSYLVVAIAYLIALVLVVAGVPWFR